MKVLFDHPNPFLLAHGGFQIQIEQTKKALEDIAVEVEWLRWWDGSQHGDIIHYFGRPSGSYIDFAHRKGMKVVMSELLTGLGSRSANNRLLQKMLMQTASKLLPGSFTARLSWDSYRLADIVIALTPWERQLMIEMFNAPPDRVFVVPNGVEEVFFEKADKLESKNRVKEKWLVCTATITERKRVLELAEAAVIAKTPVWIIGNPYSKTDPYYQRFLEVVNSSGGFVRYEGGISDRSRMAEIYKSARGFVLLSTMESLSLSALEAAASGCPLLLSDLPWARSIFCSHVMYSPICSIKETSKRLESFYFQPKIQHHQVQISSWVDVANHLLDIYLKISNDTII